MYSSSMGDSHIQSESGADHSLLLLSEDVLTHCFNYLSAWELKALVKPVCCCWKRVATTRLNLLLAVPGQEVLLHSLKDKSILNGQIGVIVKPKSKSKESEEQNKGGCNSTTNSKNRLLVKLHESFVSLSLRNLKFVGLVCPPDLESLLLTVINFPPDGRKFVSYGIPKAELETAKLYGFLRGAPGATNLILVSISKVHPIQYSLYM
uniref:F-box domain-containing protein n=1 Tax=Aplanochytrium stocchinoi TaxID=215587 RepID=A0A7S3UYQ4_9STRA